MKHYLAFDAGGTKLTAILFNQCYEIVSCVKADGVNLSNKSVGTINRIIDDGISALFADVDIDDVDGVYGWFMMNEQAYADSIRKHVRCPEIETVSEGQLGSLACGVCCDSLCVIAGTGSSIFYVENGALKDMIGGYGALVSDHGSGFDVGKNSAAGRHRLRAKKTGGPTLLYEVLREKYGRDHIRDILNAIYRNDSAIVEIASLTYAVEAAASRGDRIARDILAGAGEALGEQVCIAIRNNHIANRVPICRGGGLYSTDPLILERMREYILKRHQGFRFVEPVFQPVVGGVLYCMYKQKGDISASDFEDIRGQYSGYMIKE